MALANYTDLQSAVANFLHRGDMAGIIPDLISLAEVRFYSDIDAKLQDTVVTLSTVAGTETVALPSDFINMRSLVLLASPNDVLDYYSPDQYNNAKPWGASGKPTIYTIVNNSLYLQDIPDGVYSLKAIYKAKVPALSASGTNWLMTGFPNAYLYGTLCESAPYLKDDNRIPMWEAKYKEAIDTINRQDWANAATLRVRTDVRL